MSTRNAQATPQPSPIAEGRRAADPGPPPVAASAGRGRVTVANVDTVHTLYWVQRAGSAAAPARGSRANTLPPGSHVTVDLIGETLWGWCERGVCALTVTDGGFIGQGL